MTSTSNKLNFKKFYEVVLKFQFNTLSSFIFSSYESALEKEKQIHKELMSMSPLDRRYYDLHIYERAEGSERRDDVNLNILNQRPNPKRSPSKTINKAKEKLRKQGVIFNK